MSRIRWWWGARGQTTRVLLLVCYTARNMIMYIHALLLLTSISQNFASDLHTSVKFKLSCTVASYNVSSVWYLCVQYVKPLLHFDIRPCCHQSAHAFTSWYGSPLLDCTFLHWRVFMHEIIITFVRVMHCYRSRSFYAEFFTRAEVDKKICMSVSAFSFTDNTTCSVILIQSRKSSKYACYINSTSFGKQ